MHLSLPEKHTYPAKLDITLQKYGLDFSYSILILFLLSLERTTRMT